MNREMQTDGMPHLLNMQERVRRVRYWAKRACPAPALRKAEV